MVMQMLLICTPWYHINIITWNWEKKNLSYVSRENQYFSSAYIIRQRKCGLKICGGRSLCYLVCESLIQHCCVFKYPHPMFREIFSKFVISHQSNTFKNITFLIYYSDNCHFIFRTHFTSFVICFILMF